MMIIQFWGVRGSYNCWGPRVSKVGGHTACVTVRTNASAPPLILDAGSGIIPLGQKSELPQDIHCFITHPHLDHIMGLPYFKPLWSTHHKIHFYRGQDQEALDSVFREHLLNPPLFPVPYAAIPSSLSFHTVNPLHPTKVYTDMSVTSFKLNHPGGSSGYIIQNKSKKIVYLSDHEHHNLSPATKSYLEEQCYQADLIIFDTMYDIKDIENHRGWGHSTWIEACDFATSCQAKALALFHLNPEYSDEQLLDMEARAKQLFPGAFLAREQDIVSL